MTRKKKDFGAQLKARRVDIAGRVAESKDHHTKLEELIAEGEKLRVEQEEFERDLAKAIAPKPKGGRPPKWKGGEGYEFLTAIHDIQAARECSIAQAIKILRADNPEWAEKYKIYPKGRDDLERNFTQANKFWRPWQKRWERLDARFKDWAAQGDLLKAELDVAKTSLR